MNGWLSERQRDGGLDQVPLPRSGGALWLCGKRVVGPDPEGALARADGADVIVAFNQRYELVRDYPDYVAWQDEYSGSRGLWWEIPDLGAPTLAVGLEIVANLRERLERNEGLILHCAGGIGRAPTMASCVLVSMGMGPEEALAHVAAHRPMAGPEAGAQRRMVDDVAAHYGQ